MFKNETHNHPTEIEPFGGAATCLGGAIRDPLSGRSYVYQAMRVTGAANPLRPGQRTPCAGKLPQRKITSRRSKRLQLLRQPDRSGNRSCSRGIPPWLYGQAHGNRRGTWALLRHHDIRREVPVPGDIVILLGGKTGRDGCGGATGSSKSHTIESLEHCGAEVQKGNAPEERKLQRLFRNPAGDPHDQAAATTSAQAVYPLPSAN